MTERDDRWHCPEAIIHVSNRSGHCLWCGRKVDSAMPRPTKSPASEAVKESDEAYGMYWDPDFPYEARHYDT